MIRRATGRILDALFVSGLFLTWLRQPRDTCPTPRYMRSPEGVRDER